MIMDSVLVIFDNSDTMVHYKPNLIGGAKRFYSYDSPRNLYNQTNYQKTITKKTATFVGYQFLFIFTEQDYLDASK